MTGPTLDPTRLEMRILINTRRERVFRAWTEPEMLMKWFRASPEAIPVLAEVDLRVGGRYRMGMLNPGRNQPSIATGEYRLIQPPERLAFTWSWEGEAGPEALVTLEFNEVGNKTELVLQHANFSGVEQRDQHQQGWKDALRA